MLLASCDGNGPFGKKDPCENYETPESPNWHEMTFCIVTPTFVTTSGVQMYGDLIVDDLNISDVFPYTTDSVRLYTEDGLIRPLEWHYGNGYSGGGSWQTEKDFFLDPVNVLSYVDVEQDTSFYLFLNSTDTDTLNIRYKVTRDECNNYVFDYIHFYHNGNEMPGRKPSSDIHYIYFIKP